MALIGSPYPCAALILIVIVLSTVDLGSAISNSIPTASAKLIVADFSSAPSSFLTLFVGLAKNVSIIPWTFAKS